MRGTKWGVHAYSMNGAMDLTRRGLNVWEASIEEGEGEFISITMCKLGDGHQNEGEEQKKAEVYGQKIKDD